MDPATITAVCTGGVAVITAVTALVRQFQHENNADAHEADPPHEGPPVAAPPPPPVAEAPPSFPVIPPSGA